MQKKSRKKEKVTLFGKTEAGKRRESEPCAIRGDGRGSIFYEVFCRLRSLLRAAGGRARDGAEKLFFPPPPPLPPRETPRKNFASGEGKG